ncbi:MAG TPA: thioredoxin domain-containing protein [Myxococcales bacterium LLY-WYZ-16_1]|jgi:uncharacterized protein|nr:thioredoxin domain-containing protein [Myxococcales bacterium LLY-WYZ-16_1]
MVMELPGSPGFSPELSTTLENALRAKGPDYVPRTHHLDPDGAPRFTNRLILETSPYLLQHAHNPVNWYPWGEEAFQEAERSRRPILLSVGYSTCHWCHVMERESFEDTDIAAYINGHFVPIKVDREERPDVDGVYMTVVQLMTGGGGWPMTVVMLPDGRPFFGGTYFPPRDGDRGARIGFESILRRLREAYEQDAERVLKAADQLSSALARASRRQPPESLPDERALVDAARWLTRRFDPEHGGFGRAPKFPRPPTYELLLRYHRRTQDPAALHMVSKSLRAMADGGIYDHVGDGFARYSTDDRWLIPHFEKMLYDNAQLVCLYLEAFQATRDRRFREVAEAVCGYVAREMTSAEGGFFSATDADSEGEEGRYFVWSVDELEARLEPEELQLLQAGWGVTKAGNFGGRNVLHRIRDDRELARHLNTTEDAVRARWNTVRSKLLAARSERVPPLLDDKIIAEWNGQMISAFARAGFVCSEPRWTKQAERAADFVWEQLRSPSGRLLRTHRAGRSRHAGVLEDHAFVAAGYLDLFETTGRSRWLDRALHLMDVLAAHFWDPEHGGYFGTADDAESLLVRDKPVYDGAQPSGNSVACANHLRLHLWTADETHRERAERTLLFAGESLSGGAMENPKMAQALDFHLDDALEVVVAVGEDDPEPILGPLRSEFVPNRVLLILDGTEPPAAVAELAAGKTPVDGRTTAYVCKARVCTEPTTDPETLRAQLRATTRPIQRAPSLADGGLG